MKTTFKHLRRITAFAIALALIFAVAISCKKTTDDTPTPSTPEPNPTPPNNLFHTGFHKMMTDEEIMNHKTFGGSHLYELSKGLTEEDGPEIPYGEIVKTLWDIYDYTHTETQFEKIHDEISEISGQIVELKNEISSLSQQLSMVQTNINKHLNDLVTNTYVVDINSAWDSASPEGLQYYSKTALGIQKHTVPMTMEQLDAQAMASFVPVYGPSAPTNPMPKDINEIQNVLLGSPSGPVFGSSSIKVFADDIILFQGSPLHTPAYAMNCYKLLENYFLLAINAQFRAFIIYSNALYRAETDSAMAKYNYDLYLASFAKKIQQELSMFLTVTDYLSINLLDYRTGGGFSAGTDLRYFNYGLKPDDLFAPVIARANMLNQLVNYALGQPTKDVYLTVSVPKNYSNSGVINGTSSLTGFEFTIENLKSQFPYTGWNTTPGQTGTCYPDNSVTFYRSNEGTGGSLHQAMINDIVTINNVPWRARAVLTGSIHTGYYNPKDISAAPQSYWSATYCLAFGSASVCWYWGSLWLNDYAYNNMQEATGVQWQLGPTEKLGKQNSPMMFSHSGGDHIQHYGGNFYHSDYRLGYSGTFPTTSGGSDLFLGDMRSASIIVNSNNATYAPTIDMYLWYQVIPFNWSRSTEFYFCGTDVYSDQYNGTNGDWTLANQLNYFSSSSTKYSESGAPQTAISAGNHTFNVGFLAANPDETGHSNSCDITWYSQVIYGGKYNIISK